MVYCSEANETSYIRFSSSWRACSSHVAQGGGAEYIASSTTTTNVEVFSIDTLGGGDPLARCIYSADKVTSGTARSSRSFNMLYCLCFWKTKMIEFEMQMLAIIIYLPLG